MFTSERDHGITSIILVSFALKCCAQQYVAVPPSSRYYGQDGPWGAVTVNYGGYPSSSYSDSVLWESLDLFPAGEWTSFVISPESCNDNTTELCGIGGTSDSSYLNQTVDDQTIYWRPENHDRANSGIHWTGEIFSQTMNVGKSADRNGYTIYNTSTAIVDSLNLTTPGNKNTTAIEVGFLALGAPQQFQTFSNDDYPIMAWNLPGYLYNQSMIPSFTYTLHMGSAAFQYPVSLVFGGYDQGRMIGSPTVYHDNKVALLDIGIGVHTGKSPFTFSSKDQLLIDSSGPQSSIQVTPDSQGPYISLPKETCDAVAAELPVTFDVSGYYLWDVDDPRYQEIVLSPAYLSFTFPSSQANGVQDNVIIKVPFMLLNLTLGPVLSGKAEPVPYFPCTPFDPADGTYYLGRAFLQAALIGRQWDPNRDTMWLAQVPGPGPNNDGLGQALRDIQQSDNTLEPISGDQDAQFNSSWSGHWRPLSDSPAPVSVDDRETATGLSTGTKAGIGAGVGVGFLALLAIAGLCLWRKKKSSSTSQTEPLNLHSVDEARKDPSPPYSAVDPKNDHSGHEMLNIPQEARLQGFPSASELSGMSELPGGQDARELASDRF